MGVFSLARAVRREHGKPLTEIWKRPLSGMEAGSEEAERCRAWIERMRKATLKEFLMRGEIAASLLMRSRTDMSNLCGWELNHETFGRALCVSRGELWRCLNGLPNPQRSFGKGPLKQKYSLEDAQGFLTGPLFSSQREEELHVLSEGDQKMGIELDTQLGDGGSGNVFSAFPAGQREIGISFALKFIKPTHMVAAMNVVLGTSHDSIEDSFDPLARVFGEVEVLALLQNWVAFYDLLVGARGELVLVLERVRGESLEQLIEGGKIRTSEEKEKVLFALLRNIIPQLEVFHRAGMVSRDVKPANVLIETYARGPSTARLIDFGLVTRHGSIDADGRKFYSMPNAPLEYVRDGVVRYQHDLRSLGLLLYSVLAGESNIGEYSARWYMEHHGFPHGKESGDEAVLRALEREPNSAFPIQSFLNDRLLRPYALLVGGLLDQAGFPSISTLGQLRAGMQFTGIRMG